MRKSYAKLRNLIYRCHSEQSEESLTFIHMAHYEILHPDISENDIGW